MLLLRYEEYVETERFGDRSFQKIFWTSNEKARVVLFLVQLDRMFLGSWWIFMAMTLNSTESFVVPKNSILYPLRRWSKNEAFLLGSIYRATSSPTRFPLHHLHLAIFSHFDLNSFSKYLKHTAQILVAWARICDKKKKKMS